MTASQIRAARVLGWLLASGCAQPTSSIEEAQSTCTDPVIVNPSFETPRIAPPFQSFTNNLPGWTGVVDVHDRSDLAVADGQQVVDLNQTGRVDQPLAQPITLVPGAQYELRFSHAVNHHCTAEARFAVRVGGVYRTYHSDTTLREEHMFFIAREAASSIQFTSLTDGCGAATIDDVHVTCSTAPREWPNAESHATSDAWLTQHHDAISVMRPRIAVVSYANFADVTPLVAETVDGLARGSRYHGYDDPTAPAFLDPQVVKIVQLHDSTLFTRGRWATQQGGFWSEQRWLAGDFDHDGKTDVANVFGDGGMASIDVHRSNGEAFASWGRWSTRDGGYESHQKWLAADVDGDGRTDLVNIFNDGGLASIDVHLSTGTSFVRQRWSTRDGGFWDQQQWLAADMNGDGVADLVNVFGDTGQASIDVHISTRTGFHRARWATQQGGFWPAQHWLAGDVTGDGRADVVNVFDDGGLASIDVHVSNGAAFASWGRWSTRDGGFSSGQKWLIGDFNNDGRADLANVFGEWDAAAFTSLTSVDVHTSTGSGFARSRWETKNGGFWDAQKWLVADVNGGGYRDLVNVFGDANQASIDVHLTRGNHSSVPRRSDDPTRWDYATMFSAAFADVLALPDPGGHNQTLCELLARGDVHELWLYTDPRETGTPAALEVVESKQVYDVDGAPVPGRLEPCAGNGCLEGAAVAAAAACGRSVKISMFASSRGPGCAVHSLGHAFETIGSSRGAAQPILPPLQRDFLHFANFDLDTRLHLPAQSWYDLCRETGPDLRGIACGAAAWPACVEWRGNNALHWRWWQGSPLAVSQEGDLAAYDQGCGSVHFMPNARDDYDHGSCTSALATCSTFGARNGPGGIDAPVAHDGTQSRVYETGPLARWADCEGGWQIYWRQSFPGRENHAVAQDGVPMPNWWPYLYY